jgi:hypothetical protein
MRLIGLKHVKATVPETLMIPKILIPSCNLLAYPALFAESFTLLAMYAPAENPVRYIRDERLGYKCRTYRK